MAIKLVGGTDTSEQPEVVAAPDNTMNEMEYKLVTQMSYDVRHLLADDEFLKKKREKELENRQKL